jgi:hypothetical protein
LQNPESCEDKKFLVHAGHHAGIGSQLHVMGAALAWAMTIGRIYLLSYNPNTTIYTDGDYCPERSAIDGCFFLPISSCTLEDAGFDDDTTVVWDGGNGGDTQVGWLAGWQTDKSTDGRTDERTDGRTAAMRATRRLRGRRMERTDGQLRGPTEKCCICSTFHEGQACFACFPSPPAEPRTHVSGCVS